MSRLLGRLERRLVRRIEGSLDAPVEPSAIDRALFTYLRLRQSALVRLLRAGAIWVPSAVRIGISFCLKRGDTCIDVGANVGRVAAEAAWRVGPSGRVLCFEPAEPATQRFRLRVRRLGLRHIELRQVALGARSQRATLYVYERRAGGSSSLRPHGGDDLRETCDVATTTLDEALAHEATLPALVKIDVEGSEVDVLSGGSRLLAGPQPPCLVVEVFPEALSRFGHSPFVLLDLLHSHGYRTWVVGRYGVRAAGGVLDLPEYRHDILALHRHHHEHVALRLARAAKRGAPGTSMNMGVPQKT